MIEAADPHPHHERVEADAQLGRLARRHAGEHEVHVHASATSRMPTSVDGSNSRLPLLSTYCRFSLVMMPVRLPSRHASSPTAVTYAVERLGRRDALARRTPRVAVADRRAPYDSPGVERDVVILLERQAGERGEQHDDADVHDVAAVAPPVARDEAHERRRAPTRRGCVRRAPNALVELLPDRAGDEAGRACRRRARTRRACRARTAATPTTSPTVDRRGELPLAGSTTDALRHAMSGPTPVSASSSRPSGTFTVLKNGGPTVIFEPRTHSLRIGKSVPQSTENAMPTSTRLL